MHITKYITDKVLLADLAAAVAKELVTGLGL